MKAFFRNPTAIFFLSMVFIAGILFLFPINLFDGEILYSHSPIWEKEKLALSYFIGIGASEEQLAGIEDFRLVEMGYVLAVLFIFALPLLIAYRVHIANLNEARKKGN